MNDNNTPIIGALASSPLIRRHPANPVLDAARVPTPPH